MSTILDALKKSEQERKLSNIPTLADMPAPEERRRLPGRPWLVLIAIVFLLLVACLIYFWQLSQVQPAEQMQGKPVDNESAISEKSAEDIVVNVVSWSEQAQQRFVIIAGKLLREGEFVRPGVKVDQIRTDSVILIERGRRIERRP